MREVPFEFNLGYFFQLLPWYFFCASKSLVILFPNLKPENALFPFFSIVNIKTQNICIFMYQEVKVCQV